MAERAMDGFVAVHVAQDDPQGKSMAHGTAQLPTAHSSMARRFAGPVKGSVRAASSLFSLFELQAITITYV
jgi:hypothetical protein